MKTLVRKIKIWIKPWIAPKIVSYFFHPYQGSRFPEEKSNLIFSKIDLKQVNNVLDIGCNNGRIAMKFQKMGKFCVGIDAIPCFPSDIYNTDSPAFGLFTLTLEKVSLLPRFDLILLLSVHHQWIKQYGDQYAKQLVEKIIDKSIRYFIIEFAALSEKYGYKKPLFTDNNEESVKKYAEDWLNSINFSGNIKYIGKNKERAGREPYRYLYMIEKN